MFTAQSAHPVELARKYKRTRHSSLEVPPKEHMNSLCRELKEKKFSYREVISEYKAVSLRGNRLELSLEG